VPIAISSYVQFAGPAAMAYGVLRGGAIGCVSCYYKDGDILVHAADGKAFSCYHIDDLEHAAAKSIDVESISEVTCSRRTGGPVTAQRFPEVPPTTVLTSSSDQSGTIPKAAQVRAQWSAGTEERVGTLQRMRVARRGNCLPVSEPKSRGNVLPVSLPTSAAFGETPRKVRGITLDSYVKFRMCWPMLAKGVLANGSIGRVYAIDEQRITVAGPMMHPDARKEEYYECYNYYFIEDLERVDTPPHRRRQAAPVTGVGKR